jgi:hypothetical protein
MNMKLCLSLSLIKDHSLRVFENRVLTGIFGPVRDGGKEATREAEENCTMNFITCTLCHIPLG